MSALRGLYAITPTALCGDPETLLAACAAALRGGAVLLQYRDKAGDAARRRSLATQLGALCHRHGARFVVNDDAALARAVGADGVHLGRRDGPLDEVRRRHGAAWLIGASCGPDPARAVAAVKQGANYVAFGRFFDSTTKPDAPQATLDSLRLARRQLDVPIVAIGGVTPENGSTLIDAGADLLAAVDGVFGDPDPRVVEARARAYSRLFIPASR